MIRYALACDAGHEFESWFRSSEDYEAQEARGLVACPVCGSAKTLRQIMAPQVARKDREAPPAAPAPMALIDPEAQAMRARIAELRRMLIAGSEDVGEKFAEEARRIHYGESERRSIRGEADGEEVRALAEEGIDFMAIPPLPDERN